MILTLLIIIMKLKVRDKWDVSLSIKSDAENIKIKDIINVRDEDECYLKILNNNFNFAFKLNK